MNIMIDDIKEQVITLLPKLFFAIIILIFGWWLSGVFVKLVANILIKKEIDSSTHPFIAAIVNIALKFVVMLMALAALGINTSSIVTFFGAALVTAGFGFKDSVAQLLSGLQILVTKPFKKGDYIEVQDVSGSINEIKMMNTTLHTVDNKKIIVPNSHFTMNHIINYSAEDNRRVDLTFTIGYKDDINRAKEILTRLAAENSLVFDSPSPVIAVSKHTIAGIELIDYLWCKRENYWTIYYDMQEKVKLGFEAAGFANPVNNMDIRVLTKSSQ